MDDPLGGNTYGINPYITVPVHYLCGQKLKGERWWTIRLCLSNNFCLQEQTMGGSGSKDTITASSTAEDVARISGADLTGKVFIVTVRSEIMLMDVAHVCVWSSSITVHV